MDFAQWAGRLSQATNASLAGSRVFVPVDAVEPGRRDVLLLQMAEWGLVPAGDASEADWTYPELPDGAPQDAASAIDRAAAGMDVTRALAGEPGMTDLLQGLRIALSLIVEPKTAVLALRLQAAGARVGIYCHAHECDREVADELRRRGILVEGDPDWTPADEHAGALRLLDGLRPQVIIDDGANISRLLVMERPELLEGFLGVCEETTSGIRPFRAMQEAGELPFPVIDVNGSALKTSFDNRHGTGETCVTTCQALLGWHCFSGRRIAVIGYGPVGEGFARRVRALGARVLIVEKDPRAALRAAFAGFEPCGREALSGCDMVVSATGVRHTLGLDELQALRDGTVVAVIGGIANEVALDDARASGALLEPAGRAGISRLELPDGPALTLLAAGDGVNYAAGPGNPIQVMDLSFAVQLSAVCYLLEHEGTLPHEVVPLPEEEDRRIAAAALSARGFAATDDATPDVDDWRRTRFADTAGAGATPSPEPSAAAAGEKGARA